MLTASTLFFIRTNAQGQPLEVPLVAVNSSIFAVDASGTLVMKPFTDFVTPSALTTALGGYVTTGAFSTTLGGYVTNGALSAALPGDQRLAQKVDYFTTPIANSTTVTLSPSSAVTIVSVAVGTAGGHQANLSLSGGTVGDLVMVNYFPYVGNAQKGSLVVKSGSANIVSLVSTASSAPIQALFQRVKDDAPLGSANDWVMLGRWQNGRPVLADHSLVGTSTYGPEIQGACGPSVAFLCGNPIPDGVVLTIEITDGSTSQLTAQYTFSASNSGITGTWVDTSACVTPKDYLQALATAMGENHELSEVFPPDGANPTPQAVLLVGYTGFPGATYSLSRVDFYDGTPTGGEILVINQWEGRDATATGMLTLTTVSSFYLSNAYVIVGNEFTAFGPNQAIGLYFGNQPIGTIPASLAAGIYPLSQFVTKFGWKHIGNSGGNFYAIIPSYIDSGYARVVITPGNVQGTLAHF